MALKVPEAQDIIIVGGTGDLARRKLIPALVNRFLRDLRPEGRIIGYARSPLGEGAFEQVALNSVREFGPVEFDDRAWSLFAQRLAYVSSKEGGLAALAKATTQRTRLMY